MVNDQEDKDATGTAETGGVTQSYPSFREWWKIVDADKLIHEASKTRAKARKRTRK